MSMLLKAFVYDIGGEMAYCMIYFYLSKAWEKPEFCTKITLWHSFTRLSTNQGLFMGCRDHIMCKVEWKINIFIMKFE